MNAQARDRSPDRRDTPRHNDSLDLILGYARQSYDQQVATLETYRTRAASLLAFAAVLVTLSAGLAPDLGRSVAQAVGTISVLVATVLFLVVSSARGFRAVPSTRSLATWGIDEPADDSKIRMLRHTLIAIRSNRRALSLVWAVLSAGLAWLVGGTIIIGVRVAVLLP